LLTNGLFFLVTPPARYWRMKYRIPVKRKSYLSVFILKSLADARVKRDEARKVIADGGDPSEQKQQKLAKKYPSYLQGTRHGVA
jgi:hypothetical protein